MKIFSTIGKLALGVVVAKYVSSFVFGKFVIGKLSANISKITPTYLRLTLNIPVKNTLGVSATVQGFVGGLYYSTADANGAYQDFKIGDVIIGQPVTFKAGEEVQIQSTVLITYASLADQIQQLIISGSFLGKIKMKGTLLAANTKLPINQYIAIA